MEQVGRGCSWVIVVVVMNKLQGTVRRVEQAASSDRRLNELGAPLRFAGVAWRPGLADLAVRSILLI